MQCRKIFFENDHSYTAYVIVHIPKGRHLKDMAFVEFVMSVLYVGKGWNILFQGSLLASQSRFTKFDSWLQEPEPAHLNISMTP